MFQNNFDLVCLLLDHDFDPAAYKKAVADAAKAKSKSSSDDAGNIVSHPFFFNMLQKKKSSITNRDGMPGLDEDPKGAFHVVLHA